MEPKYKVNAGEQFYLTIQAVLSMAIYGCFFLALYESHSLWIILLWGTIFLIANLFAAIFLAGYIRGNAIKASSTQFKEVFDIVNEQAKALHLKEVPAVYILHEGGFINAFAAKLARKYYVVLLAPVVAEAYKDGEDTLSFVIGHELGHVKRNHLGFWHTMLTLPTSFLMPPLYLAYSRACEYTCDSIGHALSPSGALKGIGLLAVGPELYKKIEMRAWMSDSRKDRGFVTAIDEFFSTHPHLYNRVIAVQQQS